MDPVNEVTQACFNALSRIRQLEDTALPSPDALHGRLRFLIDGMMTNAGHAGIPQNDISDIAYAIVALADEIALNKSDLVRNYWMQQPLQMHYFRESAAGEGFFARLDRIKNDHHRAPVLRVYYLCLLLGFQGRHRIRGGEIELMNLIEQLGHQLARSFPPPADLLSPHGERPEEAMAGRGRRLPLVWMAGAALVIAIGLLLIMTSSLDGGVEDLTQKIGDLSKSAPATSQPAPPTAPGYRPPANPSHPGLKE